MSDDGADLGITAERALKTVLGGEESPTKDEGMSPAEMKAMLEAKDDDTDGYDAHAQVMAKYLVRLYEKYPEIAYCPTEDVYRKDDNGETIWEGPALVTGLSEVAKREWPDESHPFRQALSEATGFSWGWAVNAARYCLDLPPVPNPAILTVG